MSLYLQRIIDNQRSGIFVFLILNSMKSKKIFCVILYFSAFLTFGGINGFSQSKDKNLTSPEYFLSIGAGFSVAGAGPHTSLGGGLCLRGEASFAFNKIILSAYGAANTGGGSEYSGFLSEGINDFFAEIGGQIGMVKRTKDRTQIHYKAGLCALQGTRVYPDPGGWFGDGKYVDLKTTIGVPFEISWQKHKKIIGYGLTFFMNINPEEVFGGLSLNLLLGKFNYRSGMDE